MASKKTWNDHAGQSVYNMIRVLQDFTKFLKSDIVLIAEKQRSVGYLNENLTDELTKLSINQFPNVKELLNQFIGAMTQVEYGRKIMYSRLRDLETQSFASTLELARQASDLLVQREDAIVKYQQAILAHQRQQAKGKQPNPQLEIRISQANASFQALNTQAIQATGTFTNQLHRDLVTVLASFAHSQMELYARQIEAWNHVIEVIDEAPLEDDITDVVDAMNKAFILRETNKKTQ